MARDREYEIKWIENGVWESRRLYGLKAATDLAKDHALNGRHVSIWVKRRYVRPEATVVDL